HRRHLSPAPPLRSTRDSGHHPAVKKDRLRGQALGLQVEPSHRVAAQHSALALLAHTLDGDEVMHRFGELAVPVVVIRGVHDLALANGLQHVGEDSLFGLAGEAYLAARDDFGWAALEERPLGPKLFEVLVQALGPEGYPATRALHEGNFELRVAIEHAFADH